MEDVGHHDSNFRDSNYHNLSLDKVERFLIVQCLSVADTKHGTANKVC